MHGSSMSKEQRAYNALRDQRTRQPSGHKRAAPRGPGHRCSQTYPSRSAEKVLAMREGCLEVSQLKKGERRDF